MPDGTDTKNLPPTISIRTAEFAPLLDKWRARHECVPWSVLLRRALKKELAPYAGKRYAKLVDAA